nr:uncharacterized protein CI109_003412 [Kwoniella shandongensis]KAA5528124.1 hypothetical protein CI109_003412 [Kwoniella shandongensis]
MSNTTSTSNQSPKTLHGRSTTINELTPPSTATSLDPLSTRSNRIIPVRSGKPTTTPANKTKVATTTTTSGIAGRSRIHPPPIWHDQHRRLPRRPPPPPAERPVVRRTNLCGYQLDYDRVSGINETKKPRRMVSINDTEQDNDGGIVLPPPAEAYAILRPHRVPSRWWSDEISSEALNLDRWEYGLKILQSPTRGKALCLRQLSTDSPVLSPPLIVQLVINDRSSGRALPVDDPMVVRRLIHMTMMVELVSPDGTESRTLMRVRPPQGVYPQPQMGSSIRLESNLLGSTYTTAMTLQHEDKKGIFFIFSRLIVRNVGEYALKLNLVDVAGPSHIGTSIGVTNILATSLTRPFQVYHPSEYPGSLSITDQSREFIRQGVRSLEEGRKNRWDAGSSEGTLTSPERNDV